MDTYYPSLFDSDFACFIPPKPLSKTNLKDFEQWLEDYNASEVLRFVLISHLSDMMYLLHFMGDDGFSEEEVQGYLEDFGNDNKLNNSEFRLTRLRELYAEWIEFSTAASIIRDCVVEEDFLEEEDEC